MLKSMHKRIRLSVVNNVLLALIVLVNGYIILAPLYPRVEFWWRHSHSHTVQNLTKQIHTQASTPKSQAATQANTLIVPSMLLNTPVLEGPVSDTYKILDKGIWRWPLGSTPDQGGNTVLIGHRFTYTNPKGIFYYMDKVQVGNEIGLVWNNTTYRYKVSAVSVVDPSDTAITDPTTDARITMYTCTPLWNPTHRLVVVAEREAS